MKWLTQKISKRGKKQIIIIIAFLGVILAARLWLVMCINCKYEKGMSYDKNLGYAKYYLEEDRYIYI